MSKEILYTQIQGVTEDSRYWRSTYVKMPKNKSPIASNDHNISFKTF
jgi:hypothetical protein